MDIRSEPDIERLRQVALLLEAEVQRLLDVLQLKSEEVDRLRGGSGDIQQTLKLFAAKVAVDKYDLALPLARQERVMRQMGLDVHRTTLWDQLVAIERPLRPAYAALRRHVLAQDVIGLDQTSWPCLHGRRATPWQMWCLTSPDVVYHAIQEDKSAATFRDILDGFRGIVVCDALSTHIAAARGLEGVRLAHCFAHVVRRFKEAAADFPQAQVPLALLRKLYDIDAAAESDAHRRELRAGRSREVMEELKAWLTNTPSNKALSLGQAIRYTVGIWPGLTVFLENERVWPDNNRTERGLRGPVVGRKNHYGSKSRLGTQIASTFYSLVETAKLHGVPASAYLVEAVRAGRRGEVFLPWQMAG